MGAFAALVALGLLVIFNSFLMPLFAFRDLVIVSTLLGTIAASLGAIDQGEVTRQHIFGELYDRAQIEKVAFLLPPLSRYRLGDFEEDQESWDNHWSADTIGVPVGKETEIAVMFQLGEPQTLRVVTVGFYDEFTAPSETDKHLPRVTEFTEGLRKDAVPDWDLSRFYYINWHGNLKIEYTYQRRLGRDYLPLTLKVQGDHEGTYKLYVDIFTAEAPEPYRETLIVEVGDGSFYGSE